MEKHNKDNIKEDKMPNGRRIRRTSTRRPTTRRRAPVRRPTTRRRAPVRRKPAKRWRI